MQSELAALDPKDPNYAVTVVERLLGAARRLGASDLHLRPTAEGLEVRLRLDGVLQRVAVLPRPTAANVVARLKVLADLLTYRTDVPQEGRVRAVQEGGELRVSTFPTVFGENAVVRLFAGSQQFQRLDDLGADGFLRRAAYVPPAGERTRAIVVCRVEFVRPS